MLYGQQAINGHWYLFDRYSGAMLTGFQNLAPYGQDKIAYYNKYGQMFIINNKLTVIGIYSINIAVLC